MITWWFWVLLGYSTHLCWALDPAFSCPQNIRFTGQAFNLLCDFTTGMAAANSATLGFIWLFQQHPFNRKDWRQCCFFFSRNRLAGLVTTVHSPREKELVCRDSNVDKQWQWYSPGSFTHSTPTACIIYSCVSVILIMPKYMDEDLEFKWD